MPVRPPRSLAPRALASNPLAVFERELLQEAAASLGDAGRRLEAALSALRDFEEAGKDDAQARAALVSKAGDMLWRYLVQREACGLRDSETIMRQYQVPAAVRRRMGIVGPRQ